MKLDKLYEILDKINQQPFKIKAIILVVLIGIMCGGYWHWFWKDNVNTLSGLIVQVQNERKTLEEYQAIAKELPKFKKEFDELNKQFKAATRKLPTKQEIPGLIDSVYEAVSQVGLTSNTFTPQSEVRKEIYAEIPVKMTVSGGYYQLARFFDQVSRLPRIVNIKNLDLKKGKKGSRGLEASFSTVTFRILPDQPVQKGGGKKGKGKGKAKSKGR